MNNLLKIMENAVIGATASAKLHHMSDDERREFISDFQFCSDPGCHWCASLKGAQEKEKQ